MEIKKAEKEDINIDDAIGDETSIEVLHTPIITGHHDQQLAVMPQKSSSNPK